MILAIGSTGTGKTNSLMSFLAYKNDSFYKIILYTGSTGEEPLISHIAYAQRTFSDVFRPQSFLDAFFFLFSDFLRPSCDFF